jgi:phenylalanyl-tRNA synthetase beta subunit
MRKLTMPEIIGKMSATQTILEVELSTVLKVYGDNIPADAVKRILEDLQKRMKDSNEAWENRAS